MTVRGTRDTANARLYRSWPVDGHLEDIDQPSGPILTLTERSTGCAHLRLSGSEGIPEPRGTSARHWPTRVLSVLQLEAA